MRDNNFRRIEHFCTFGRPISHNLLFFPCLSIENHYLPSFCPISPVQQDAWHLTSLTQFDPSANDTEKQKFLEEFVSKLNAADSPFRNRLLRLTADSPDLLAVIKQEGQV